MACIWSRAQHKKKPGDGSKLLCADTIYGPGQLRVQLRLGLGLGLGVQLNFSSSLFVGAGFALLFVCHENQLKVLAKALGPPSCLSVRVSGRGRYRGSNRFASQLLLLITRIEMEIEIEKEEAHTI